jgi:hypothetical protein
LAYRPDKTRRDSGIALFAIHCVASGVLAYWTIKIATGHMSTGWQWLSDLLAIVVTAASALGTLIQGNAHNPDPARYIIVFLIYLVIFRVLTAVIRHARLSQY